MAKMTLQDIANFWNEFASSDQEPDMEALNKMIADNGYVNDCHEQWGICHSDTEQVTLRDDMTAYVSNREL